MSLELFLNREWCFFIEYDGSVLNLVETSSLISLSDLGIEIDLSSSLNPHLFNMELPAFKSELLFRGYICASQKRFNFI